MTSQLIAERSYGIIPVRFHSQCQVHSQSPIVLSASNTQVLLIHQKTYNSGLQWSIPKGHAEPSDTTPLETAKRELHEETGLEVIGLLLQDREWKEQYVNPEKGHLKQVLYWIATVRGDVRAQESEVAGWRWCAWEEAIELATWEACKRVLGEVMNALGSTETGGMATHREQQTAGETSNSHTVC
ncbi:hypothetical protein MMC19_007639 [Ptychographa xylographoides]|nr:hypothetical protein [Ptychographa xylographoides]